MRKEVVQYLSEKDEEFASLLIDIGMKTNVAKVLVDKFNIKPVVTVQEDIAAMMKGE